jgi:UDP-N-acetylmuramyl pentapeptide phosphotransferase/UDP-N-acetylglucosamine-1-phosphate transferase
MQYPGLVAGIAIAAGLIACLGTRVLIPLLRRAAVLDQPNQRSSHLRPVPRGGGIAPVAAIALAWIALVATGLVGPSVLFVLVGAMLLAAVSWLDDLGDLPPATRLFAQAAAVIGGMVVEVPAGPIFQGWLPVELDVVAAALLWVWFVNLFNFMDGIDGLAGSEAAAIGIGLFLLAGFGARQDPAVAALAVVIALAALGFLVWNWAPARIFLGDAGSVPLGYLLGFLLIDMAAHGRWKPALILPLYFLADATITLLRRLARGERVWEAHRGHYYQRATVNGLRVPGIVARVFVVNLALAALAAATLFWPSWPVTLAALAAGLVLVAILLRRFARAPAPAPAESAVQP